jgi:GTP-binding protein EngB required for normal cell division
MVQPDAYQTLLDALKSAAGLLELPPDAPLQRDVMAVCNQLGNPNFRIMVFAPFNYGKSTLLNALLGERALPIDLIPTTGAAITVRYGDTLRTRIRFSDGRETSEPGTEVLKRFAILDEQRRMRQDVAAVEVFCPHPLLKTGVELVDLPGTDDREAQDALVKDQLLTADLVVQVLDGRKLMTLGEREHLRDWLLDRGIETVVFVVNFLNLLDQEEQKQVYNRLRFVAESFRAKLPPGVSNLYRVDALPALRARLKGDMAAAQTVGLPMFESALQTIVQGQQEQTQTRVPRVKAIARQVQQSLQARTDAVTADLAAVANKQQQKLQIQQQAADLIRKGFTKTVEEFTQWLSLSSLLDRYQEAAAQALLRGDFRTWETGEFKKTAIDHQQAIVKWVHQACEFFERERPNQFLIAFPPVPTTPHLDPPPLDNPSSGSTKPDNLTPTALATGLGWVLGGPVGGAILGSASYLLNKALEQASDDVVTPAAPSTAQMTYACLEATREYLINFSSTNLAALQRYELAGDRIIQYKPIEPATQTSPQQYQLNLLRSTLERLEQALRAVG